VNEMQDFKDMMSKSLYGISASEAMAKGICVHCKEEALPKCYSEAGIKEYHITGLCEECWDTYI